MAAARNAGVAASSGEYVVFLDEAASPKRGWLGALSRTVEGRPAVAAAGARLLAPDRTIRAAGVAIGQDRLPRPLYAGFPADHPAVNRARPVPALAGERAAGPPGALRGGGWLRDRVFRRLERRRPLPAVG